MLLPLNNVYYDNTLTNEPTVALPENRVIPFVTTEHTEALIEYIMTIL